jgi:hypothetical protein
MNERLGAVLDRRKVTLQLAIPDPRLLEQVVDMADEVITPGLRDSEEL